MFTVFNGGSMGASRKNLWHREIHPELKDRERNKKKKKKMML